MDAKQLKRKIVRLILQRDDIMEKNQELESTEITIMDPKEEILELQQQLLSKMKSITIEI